MTKKALITGITGQDGAYLAEFLIRKGYKVYGAVRRTSSVNTSRLSYIGVLDKIEIVSMDIAEITNIQRLIERIQAKESFYDIAYICEDFDTFITEISEWGVDHIGGVDFDDPEVNRGMMNAFFASFGCTPDNPHPCSKYALPEIYG